MRVYANGGLHADHSLAAGRAACGSRRLDVDARHLESAEAKTHENAAADAAAFVPCQNGRVFLLQGA
jgi:hypothetical protein